MIDIHNHLLPGIDDGAPNLDTSLAMARQAVDQGISHCVSTPHIQPGRFDNTLETIAEAHRRLAEGLIAAGIPLQTSFAAEVHFGLEVMEGITAGSLPLLGQWQGKSVLLLEFPHGAIPFGADRLTGWLLAREVIPMIAHPERNRAVIGSPGKLKPFIDQGCLMQVTAASLLGRFGQSAQAMAETLLAEDKVTVVATDAHDEVNRPPLLGDGAQRLAALVGEARSRRLVRDNPWHIVEGHFSS